MSVKHINILLIFLAIGLNAKAVSSPKPGECDIQVTNLNFGQIVIYDIVPETMTTSITVRCNAQSGTFDYSLTFSAGNSGNASARTLKRSNSKKLTYNIFRDNAYSTILNTTVAGSITGTITGDPWYPIQSNTHTIYGRIPVGQSTTSGNYNDSMKVTLIYSYSLC